MTATFITPDDLSAFRTELLKDVTAMFSSKLPERPKIELMRTKEVMQFLKCSESTIDKLKKTGRLPFSRVIRTIYFKRADVEELLNQEL